jgi:hypothetical protein
MRLEPGRALRCTLSRAEGPPGHHPGLAESLEPRGIEYAKYLTVWSDEIPGQRAFVEHDQIVIGFVPKREDWIKAQLPHLFDESG